MIIYNFYFQQPTFQKGSRIWVSQYRNNFLQHGWVLCLKMWTEGNNIVTSQPWLFFDCFEWVNCSNINPLHPDISLCILHTVLCTFPPAISKIWAIKYEFFLLLELTYRNLDLMNLKRVTKWYTSNIIKNVKLVELIVTVIIIIMK